MKRGVRLPWRVAYRWSNDIKGTKACSDQETAEFKADEIRRAGQRRDDASVVVTVTHRDAGAAGQADYQAGGTSTPPVCAPWASWRPRVGRASGATGSPLLSGSPSTGQASSRTGGSLAPAWEARAGASGAPHAARTSALTSHFVGVDG
jgi:hypothetical protein